MREVKGNLHEDTFASLKYVDFVEFDILLLSDESLHLSSYIAGGNCAQKGTELLR